MGHDWGYDYRLHPCFQSRHVSANMYDMRRRGRLNLGRVARLEEQA